MTTSYVPLTVLLPSWARRPKAVKVRVPAEDQAACARQIGFFVRLVFRHIELQLCN